ncbi:uncharacterized protein LOC119669566 [Teleopsis dalmanni]|uniref:uncharacterized protein LOC119669566 n=1 Tax=Teleopsis dalmanni TaxID=139649 RepID=UPI0018CE79E5|nr:uncharacterized protein LOC119669566 [Teleopsis dalmanni]
MSCSGSYWDVGCQPIPFSCNDNSLHEWKMNLHKPYHYMNPTKPQEQNMYLLPECVFSGCNEEEMEKYKIKQMKPPCAHQGCVAGEQQQYVLFGNPGDPNSYVQGAHYLTNTLNKCRPCYKQRPNNYCQNNPYQNFGSKFKKNKCRLTKKCLHDIEKLYLSVNGIYPFDELPTYTAINNFPLMKYEPDDNWKFEKYKTSEDGLSLTRMMLR